MASMESTVNPISSETYQEGNQRKRRKISHDEESNDQNSLSEIPWKSETEQQIYSSKLVEALRRVLRQDSPSPARPRVGRDVREIADRVLAARAKGRSRWSRAILASPLSRRKFQRQHKKAKKAAASGVKKKSEVRRERMRLPAVQRKARVLGRLVPGCRKASFTNLLEETSDYISALQMQVRAMTALTQLLTGGSPSPADRSSL